VPLALAGVVSLLAGTLLVLAPAADAASSAYTVTELPLPPPAAESVAIADSVTADQSTDTVYAPYVTGQVAVIDGADNQVTTLVTVPAGTVAPPVAVDADSDTVYAIGYPGAGAAVYVIDGATNTVETTISLPTGLETAFAAVDPVTDMVYLVESNETVVVINGGTDSVTATIPLADPTLAPNAAIVGIAVDTANDMIYLTDIGDDQVAVINGATNAVTSRIALPADSVPQGVAVDPTAGLVYVADQGNPDGATGAIFVIDAATNNVSTLTSGLAQPQGLALDTGSGTLYATGTENDLGTTYVIDTASGVIADQINRGGSSVAVTGGSVYIDGSSGVSQLENDVTIMTPSTVNTMSPVLLEDGEGPFLVGESVQAQMSASATPAATFSAVGLPAWLTLSESGLLTGTPPAGSGGSYTVTVTAANGIAPSDSVTFTLTVEQAPAITSADRTTFTTGVAGSFTMTATGYYPPEFSETGPLPNGLTLTVLGVLSGTPAAGTAGSYPITVTATNELGPVTQAFTLTVAQAYEVQASQQSGFCLDNTGGSSTDGNPVQVWSCLGNANQGWLYVPSVNGIAGDYQLQNSNGLCLDDPADSAVNGTRVQLWSCLGNVNQQWTAVTADGSFTEYVNANGLCLDNTGNAAADGNRVQVWACTGDAAQHWYGPSPDSATIPPAYPVQASQASGYCLDNAGGSSTDGNPIQVWSCLGNPNQAWKYVPSVNGVTGDYQLENSNGLCLDDPGDSAVSGTRVQLWSCLGDPSQLWTQKTTGSYVEYVNANGLCLDNTGNTLTDGNRVQVWTCLADPAQQWDGPSPQSST
jgi:DNA-binding beta-propeller fold protein YncE